MSRSLAVRRTPFRQRLRRLSTRLLVVLVTSAPLPALALDLNGVKLVDRTEVGGRELMLNGAGTRTKLLFKIYVGSLFLPQAAKDTDTVLAQSPRRIRMDLLRNLSADQLSDALLEGLKDNNSEAELVSVRGETDQMVAAMKGFGDVRKGSVVTLDFVDGATRIALDGKAKATIPGEAFNRALTRVWLGSKPAQEDLKKAMLGGTGP
jgi:chalcone isomerase-like protein